MGVNVTCSLLGAACLVYTLNPCVCTDGRESYGVSPSLSDNAGRCLRGGLPPPEDWAALMTTSVPLATAPDYSVAMPISRAPPVPCGATARLGDAHSLLGAPTASTKPPARVGPGRAVAAAAGSKITVALRDPPKEDGGCAVELSTCAYSHFGTAKGNRGQVCGCASVGGRCEPAVANAAAADSTSLIRSE